MFRALDFPDAVGLEPSPAFKRELLGPRPELLADTPEVPARPLFDPNPHEDPRPAFWRLVEHFGLEGFDHTLDPEEHDYILDTLADPDHPWDEADRGGVAGRINWRAATERTPSELAACPLELALCGPDETAEIVAGFIERLELGIYLRWEARLRLAQGLELSPDQAAALADTSGSGRDGMRPREPWYQTLRLLAATLVDWSTREGDIYFETALGTALIEAIDTYGAALSLPHDCDSVFELLPQQIRHKLLVHDFSLCLAGLRRADASGRVLSISDELDRIDDILEALEDCRASLEFLGWGARELLSSEVSASLTANDTAPSSPDRGHHPEQR